MAGHKMHRKHSKKSQKKKGRRASAGMDPDLSALFSQMRMAPPAAVSAVGDATRGAASAIGSVAQPIAQGAVAVGNAIVPPIQGQRVFSMGRSRGSRGAPARSRSRRDATMSAVGTRSSSRVGKKTKRYSPPKSTVSKSRKAAAKKAASTRRKNLKEKAAKRRAAAIKAANTRRANDLSNLFGNFGL